MTIRDAIRAVWAGKYYVLAAMVIVLGTAWLYLERQQLTFQATAVVEIASPDGGGDQSQNTGTSVNTDTRIVVSDDVAAAAAAALGYPGDPAALAARVQPAFDNANQQVDVTALAASAAEAQAIANAFAQAYVEYLPQVVNQQIAQFDERRQPLRDRLATVTAQLAKDPTDPLAIAEQSAIVEQYQNISRQVSSLQSIPQPGRIERSATSAISLAGSPDIVLAVALLAGLVAGVGIALARWGLDFRVRTATEAERNAGAPLLAEVYGVSLAVREYKRHDLLPVSSRVASPFTESIRELRTAIQVTVSQQGGMVVLVTAADARAPRSFIVANLAASWALSGRRTAIVAGDMRRPDLQGLLPAIGVPDRFGVMRTEVPNLSLLVINKDEMDPADYLATAEVGQAIADLRRKADVVLIDAPPVLAAADAAILGGYSDGCVVIATVGRTDRTVLKEAADRLRDNDVKVTGLAVAGVKSNRRMAYAGTYGGRQKAGRSQSETPAIEQRAEVVATEPVSSAEPETFPTGADADQAASVNQAYIPARPVASGSPYALAPKSGGGRPGPNSLRPAPRRLGGPPTR